MLLQHGDADDEQDDDMCDDDRPPDFQAASNTDQPLSHTTTVLPTTAVIELSSDSDLDHTHPKRPPYSPITGGIRFTCSHSDCVTGRRRPVSKLRHLHAHWRSAHRAELEPQPLFRFGIDWEVFCHKCKRAVTLGLLQRHQDEQHTGELFAVAELHDRLCCALCSTRTPERDVLFEHYVWLHQQTAGCKLMVNEWLTDERLDAVCELRVPGEVILAENTLYCCPECGWHVTAVEDDSPAGVAVVEHLWRQHLLTAAGGDAAPLVRTTPYLFVIGSLFNPPPLPVAELLRWHPRALPQRSDAHVRPAG